MNHSLDDLDDLSPEEAAAAGHDLLPLLRYVFRTPEPLSDVEQEQMVPRVRERLLRAEREIVPDEGVPHQEEQVVPLAEELTTARLQPVTVPPVTRRHSGVLPFLSGLAAVLVVGALIAAELLLFHHAPRTSTIVREGPPVTIQAAHNGLEASMTLTGGPYFLSETLAVDLTLTNHTHTTYALAGSAIDSTCPSRMGVTMTGEGLPRYSFPQGKFIYRCVLIPGSPFKPGQTVTLRHYQTLTASGKVTLTEWASIWPSPPDGYWPTMTIEVSARVPQGYHLSFKQEGTQVSVIAPAGARSHLLYAFSVSCQTGYDPGTSGTVWPWWQPLSTTTVDVPTCYGTARIYRDFGFSAPGYATVVGSASF